MLPRSSLVDNGRELRGISCTYLRVAVMRRFSFLFISVSPQNLQNACYALPGLPWRGNPSLSRQRQPHDQVNTRKLCTIRHTVRRKTHRLLNHTILSLLARFTAVAESLEWPRLTQVMLPSARSKMANSTTYKRQEKGGDFRDIY